MKPYQIVVDTNVLISGLRSKLGASYKLLTMLKDERWQINVSTKKDLQQVERFGIVVLSPKEFLQIVGEIQ